LWAKDDVVVVGRIVSDSETQASASVKLNDSSVALEASRMMGSGARIPLQFDSNLKIRRGRGGIGLFPGAIAALKGRNGGGGWFSVTEMLSVSVTLTTCTGIILW
jgi:DNA polymerase alpha subunit B